MSGYVTSDPEYWITFNDILKSVEFSYNINPTLLLASNEKLPNSDVYTATLFICDIATIKYVPAFKVTSSVICVVTLLLAVAPLKGKNEYIPKLVFNVLKKILKREVI